MVKIWLQLVLVLGTRLENAEVTEEIIQANRPVQTNRQVQTNRPVQTSLQANHPSEPASQPSTRPSKSTIKSSPSSLRRKNVLVPFNQTTVTIDAEAFFRNKRSIALYHAGVLLTSETPIVRMGTKSADVYLVISMDDLAEATAANCLNKDTVGKLSKHVMHSSASLVSQAIEAMGISVTYTSHIQDTHKIPADQFGNLQVQQNKGWLSSSSEDDLSTSTTMPSTTMPVTTTMVQEVSKFQKDDPEYLQTGLGGIETADAEAVVDKPGYGLGSNSGEELDKQLDSEGAKSLGSDIVTVESDQFGDYAVDNGGGTNFDNGLSRTVFDFDKLELEFGPNCCQDCLCRNTMIGTEEVIDLGQPVEAVIITVKGLSLEKVPMVKSVENPPDFGWLFMNTEITLVLGMVLETEPALKYTNDEVKVAFEEPISGLRIMISIQGCFTCDDAAMLTFEKSQSQRQRRNVMTDFIGSVDSKEFFKQVQQLNEQADQDRAAIAEEDKRIRNELSKARVARTKVNDLVGSIADRVCENNALVSALQMQVELKLHASNIASHVANEIGGCRADSLPSMISQKEIKKACEEEYPLMCSEEFLFQFKTASSCTLQAVVVSTHTIVLKMVMAYPKGPQIDYQARKLTIVPVFNDAGTETATFKAKDHSMLIRTASGHQTVISSCQSRAVLHIGTWICDIENVDQVATRCIKQLLQGSGQLSGQARKDCIDFGPVAQDCFVKRIANMLWTSSKIPIPIVNTNSRGLHGFWDQTRQVHIEKGVSLITEDKATAIQCEGFIYETLYNSKVLDITELDHFQTGVNINIDVVKLRQEERAMANQPEELANTGIGFKVNRWLLDEPAGRKTLGFGTVVILIILMLVICCCLRWTAAGARILSSIMVSLRRCCPCLRTRLRFNSGQPAQDRRLEMMEMS